MDLEVMLRKALRIRYRLMPDRLNKILHKLRYIIATVFLALPIYVWYIQPLNMNYAVATLKFSGDHFARIQCYSTP